MDIPALPIHLGVDDIQRRAPEVLQVARKDWFTNGRKIKSKPLTDGLSNILVGFHAEDTPEDVVIVKVYGANTELMINRKSEIETMKLLHKKKCGAEIYATFQNGICYEYVNGVPISVETCKDPSVYPLIAGEMAKMHSSQELESHVISNSESTKQSKMWDQMRKFNDLAENIIATNPELALRLREVGVEAGWGTHAINELEKIIDAANMPVAFCHNDLLLGNIIFNEKKRQITFIDVEYAMLNYPAFDVANHFLEFAGIVDIDYSRCPNHEFQSAWIAEYLKHLKIDRVDISQNQFEKWVKVCFPASHLMWGLWAIVQAQFSTIDFDYVQYVGLRLSEYKKLMENLHVQNGDSEH